MHSATHRGLPRTGAMIRINRPASQHILHGVHASLQLESDLGCSRLVPSSDVREQRLPGRYTSAPESFSRPC